MKVDETGIDKTVHCADKKMGGLNSKLGFYVITCTRDKGVVLNYLSKLNIRVTFTG